MFHNILVRMPNWLGDAVMATPILADLRKKWPKAKITAMCQNTAEYLQGNPHVDETLVFPASAKSECIKKIRSGHFDLGILLTNSFSSAWWFWRGKVKERIGFKNEWRSWMLTESIPEPHEKGCEHLVITYKRLLEPLGIPCSEVSPELFVTPNERERVAVLLNNYNVLPDERVIGVNPSAAFGPAKCWLPERFREVTIRLLQEDARNRVIFFGDKASQGLVGEICAGLSSRVINLAGITTLRELIALIERCDLFLTNDSGPMHIAAALKTPLVALFGSTSDVATGPYQHGRVIHKHVDCSPCYLRTCPIDFRCMKRIEVDEVMQAIHEELQVR